MQVSLLLLVLSGLEAWHEGWHDVLLGCTPPPRSTAVTLQVHIHPLPNNHKVSAKQQDSSHLQSVPNNHKTSAKQQESGQVQQSVPNNPGLTELVMRCAGQMSHPHQGQKLKA